MKKCIKRTDEPTCLTDFRTANPRGTWEQFRVDAEAYATLRRITKQDQGGLCAYCEIRLEEENEQIAHFHPKSDTRSQNNWALDWTNLWLACKGGSQSWLVQNPHHYLPPLPENLSCDEYKGAKDVDGLVLAPHQMPNFPRIFRFEQQLDRIEIHVDWDGCQQAGLDPQKVQQTIDEFNLNCTRLASARLALHRELEKALKRLRESNVDPNVGFATLARKHLAKDGNGYWPQFFTLIRWRFSKYAEDYLRSIQYTG